MRVVICTPCYSGKTACAFTDSLIGTVTSPPDGWQAAWAKHIGSPNLPMARAIVTAQAMAWGADRLFFIDDDISWDPIAFWGVVTQPRPIISGAYPMYTKVIDINRPLKEQVKVCYRPLKDEPTDLGGGIERVFGTGFGWICIDRSVFEALKPTTRKMEKEPLGDAVNVELFDYFNGAPEREGDEHLGEDFAFCRRARNAGFDVLVDKNIPLTHHEGRMGLTTVGTRYG